MFAVSLPAQKHNKIEGSQCSVVRNLTADSFQLKEKTEGSQRGLGHVPGDKRKARNDTTPARSVESRFKLYTFLTRVN